VKANYLFLREVVFRFLLGAAFFTAFLTVLFLAGFLFLAAARFGAGRRAVLFLRVLRFGAAFFGAAGLRVVFLFVDRRFAAGEIPPDIPRGAGEIPSRSTVFFIMVILFPPSFASQVIRKYYSLIRLTHHSW
jgi:hypothetical protein